MIIILLTDGLIQLSSSFHACISIQLEVVKKFR